MTLSLIIPSFNSAGTIEAALGSAAAQSTADLEIISIDGGSTDGTMDILDRFNDLISYRVSERDKGISHAFNKGIAAASGTMIGILGADDVLPDDVVRRIVELAQTFPTADVIYGDAYCFDNEDVYLHRSEPTLARLKSGPVLRHCSTWIRASSYHRFGGYDESLRFAMDYELCLRFASLGAEFVYVPEILGAYSTGGTNTRSRIRTIREVASISKRFGYSMWTSELAASVKCLKHACRRSIPGFVLRPVLNRYRRMRGGSVPISSPERERLLRLLRARGSTFSSFRGDE